MFFHIKFSLKKNFSYKSFNRTYLKRRGNQINTITTNKTILVLKSNNCVESLYFQQNQYSALYKDMIDNWKSF